jgi:hypothetical protein
MELAEHALPVPVHIEPPPVLTLEDDMLKQQQKEVVMRHLISSPGDVPQSVGDIQNGPNQTQPLSVDLC